MRAVKDGLPAPYGEGEESELPRWTRAVWDSLVTPRENNGREHGKESFDWEARYVIAKPWPLCLPSR